MAHHRITCMVVILVVDALEIIQVNIAKSKNLVVLCRLVHGEFQLFHEGTAVEQIADRVGSG